MADVQLLAQHARKRSKAIMRKVALSLPGMGFPRSVDLYLRGSMKPGEKEYSVWAAGGIGSTKKAGIKERLAAADDLLCKCGFMWIDSVRQYRAFNTCEAVNQCTCSGTAHGDPNCKVHGRKNHIFIILIQSKKDPTHVWPVMNVRNNPEDRGLVLSFDDIGAARRFKAEWDAKYQSCKHHVIELPV